MQILLGILRTKLLLYLEEQKMRQETTQNRTLWTIADVAREMGIEYQEYYQTLAQFSEIPKPDTKFGRRKYYTSDMAKRIIEAYKKNNRSFRGIRV
jgi:hypothetical protein